MASSSTTSDRNTNIEGTTSNNNDIKEGMNSTSNNKDISEGHAIIFVAYNGKWEYDGREWFFKNSRSSIMVVPKHVTLSDLTDILHQQLKVNKMFYRLKLEVHYRTGSSPWFPVIEIQNNQDLSVFISTRLPLCVSQLDEKFANVVQDKHSSDVDDERRKDDNVENRLIKAIRKGDWIKAREIVNTQGVTWTSKLDDDGNTALHFAVSRYENNEVVRDILMGINRDLLVTTVNSAGFNPAHLAAAFGNTEALKIMLDSNRQCFFTPDNYDFLAIHYALAIPAIKTFLYLFKQMKSYKVEYEKLFRGMRGINLLHQVIDTGLIDVAYELINDYPSLATTVYRDKTALECIVSKPELFNSGTFYGFYSRFFYHIVPIKNNNLGSNDTADVESQETPKKDKSHLHKVISRICVKLLETTLLLVPYIKHLKDDKVKHNTTIKLLRRICEEADRTYTSSDIERLYSSSFCLAVENDNVEAIAVLTTYFAGLYASKKDGHNIYQLSVLNRSEKVYNYILYHGHDTKIDFSISIKDDGNLLHLAGCLGPIHKLNAAFGAALQWKREFQWFQEVKRVVGITKTRELNKNKETPMMVFRKEHQKLRKDGEEWMKKTADSYTITAILIITIVFAAAITVPGGNDDKTGKPIYETKASLIIFALSDAISLFTSTTSLLLLLSILTASYADEDFLYWLPSRLIYGLVMLFVSMISMMIAFSASLYIMFGQGKPLILFPIAALACLPIASFVTLQFPLLVELISSTYGHGIVGYGKRS